MKYNTTVVVILSVALFLVGAVTRDSSVYRYVTLGFLLVFVDLILVSMEKQKERRVLEKEERLRKQKEHREKIQKRSSENRNEKSRATMELADRYEEKEIK